MLPPPAKRVKSTIDEENGVHEELCSRFNIHFTTVGNGDAIAVNPTFIHQFYPKVEEALGSLRNCQIEVYVDTRSLLVLLQGTQDGLAIGEEELQKLLFPIISKMSDGSFYFDKTKFDVAVKEIKSLKGDSISSNSLNYFITQGNLGDNELASFNSRVQPLLLFFIDGASIIDPTDKKWLIYFLTDLEGEIYAFSSMYPFLLFPDKKRLRISQFFVMPPHQRKGFGSILYGEIMKSVSRNDDVKEVTVEDPSETFTLFRLANDFALTESGDVPKLTAIQTTDVTLFQRYCKIASVEESSEEFAEFRKQVKKHLLRKYPECIPTDREAKIAVLESLFTTELELYRRVHSDQN